MTKIELEKTHVRMKHAWYAQQMRELEIRRDILAKWHYQTEMAWRQAMRLRNGALRRAKELGTK
jgi:hypothetical protein